VHAGAGSALLVVPDARADGISSHDDARWVIRRAGGQ